MKRISAVVALLLGLLLVQTTGLRAQSTEPLNLNYTSFSNVSFLSMNGAAAQANAALRLTPATTQTAGSAYYSDRMLDLTQPIHTSFSFFLHDSNTPVHADGITFTLQTQGLNALGAAGGGLGYAGISPSAAVHFDTFKSTSNPTGSQVGIDSGGSISSGTTAAAPFDLYGAQTYAWVDYDPATTTLQVFVSRTNTKPSTPLLTSTINLATAIGPNAFAGFTGATGADDQINDITSWALTASAVVQAPSTAQPTLGPGNPVTPAPTTAPSRALILPNKTLTVSPPFTVAGSPVSNYTVTVTSSEECFPLDEPINIYTLGNPSAIALSPISANIMGGQDKNHLTFTVDPMTHTAIFSLEVFNAALDATGLAVKAVWSIEGVERVVTLVPPATATPTATELPGQATDTPTVTPTVAPTTTPTVTGTPPATATATPTATPVPAGSLPLRTCIEPNPVPSTGQGTLFGQTTPGAVCTASVKFGNGKTPVGFDGGPQTALRDGFVVFPFASSTTAGSGTAKVTCTLNGVTVSSISTFLISQPGGSTNAALGTLPVTVSVSPETVSNGQAVTITAHSTPNALCVAQIDFVATAGIPFNGFAQKVPGNGTISWTFTLQTPGTGQATAVVNCVAGIQTGQASANFTVTT
jgi:hypothetical protein